MSNVLAGSPSWRSPCPISSCRARTASCASLSGRSPGGTGALNRPLDDLKTADAQPLRRPDSQPARPCPPSFRSMVAAILFAPARRPPPGRISRGGPDGPSPCSADPIEIPCPPLLHRRREPSVATNHAQPRVNRLLDSKRACLPRPSTTRPLPSAAECHRCALGPTRAAACSAGRSFPRRWRPCSCLRAVLRSPPFCTR